MSLLTAAAATVVACAGSDSPATPASSTATYSLAMHQDSVAVYGCTRTQAECMACSFYCQYYVPRPAQFGATLSLKPGDTTAVFQTLAGTSRTTGDSVEISVKISIYCEYYYLKGTITGASISGRWSQTYDCHGLNRIGTFTGKR